MLSVALLCAIMVPLLQIKRCIIETSLNDHGCIFMKDVNKIIIRDKIIFLLKICGKHMEYVMLEVIQVPNPIPPKLF